MPPSSDYESPKWWKEACVYQVYPASFKDTNADGWGDIPGVISKLDYLKELGVNAIWLSPIFKSPQVDMGYDISDYQDIDPLYGSLSDVDTLIAELGKRNMNLILDLVLNHTSTAHPWFASSSSSLISDKRDWYIWRPPSSFNLTTGNPEAPNNWSGLLNDNASAWTFHEQTGEYYLSLFTPSQPDLNWENQAVRHALYSMMRWWLDKGVKGLRLDVINCISKHQNFPNAEITVPNAKFQPGYKYFVSGPRFHEFLREMHDQVLSLPRYNNGMQDGREVLTVGECDYAPNQMEEALRTVATHRRELSSCFQFEYITLDEPNSLSARFDEIVKWDARDLSRITRQLHGTMREGDGWLTNVLENHDQPRSVGRFVPDEGEYRELGAKLLALVETTLGGTLYLYQGQELGARNMPKGVGLEEYKDVFSINYWQKMLERTKELSEEERKKKLEWARYMLQRRARDHSRYPMMWDDTPNGGFCEDGVKPWMRVHDDYETFNAKAQMEQEHGLSVSQFWQRGLANRKEHRGAFVYGGYRGWDEENEKVFAYERWTTEEWGTLEGQDEEKSRWLIVTNFSGHEAQWQVPEELEVQKWVAGNYTAGSVEKETHGQITLRPWEGILGMCSY